MVLDKMDPNPQKRIMVLLCSPRGRDGGIGMWTENVLNFYDSIASNTNINIKWAYSTCKKHEVLSDTPILSRIRFGLLTYLPFIQLLRKELSQHNWDVVHFSSSASISLLKDIISIYFAHKNKTKAVIHFHFGRIPEIFENGGWEKFLIRLVISKADAVIVLDKKSYNVLVSKGYENAHLLPNPLSDEVNKLILANHEIVRKEREVLFVGHLVKGKGVYELVEACSRIPDIHLTMVGSGSESTIKQLKDIAGKDNNEWLTFAGKLPSEKVIEAMLGCSIFVLPSYTEGFPNVIIESMACACPIIATDVGAIPEILDFGSCENLGVCVNPRQVQELRDAIVYLLNDKVVALQCGIRAKHKVHEMYTISRVWKQVASIWISVVGTRADIL